MQINQNKRKQRLILLSFVASFVLTGLKFFAYFLTDSNAILSDAIESIINVIASGFAFYSIRLSALPKDKNHPYGHGKVEFFSAGFEGALIIIASFFIAFEAIQRLLNPSPLQNLSSGMLIILVTLVINGVIGMLLVQKGKKYNSLALTADGRHLLSDSLSSVLLLISVLLVIFTGQVWIDSAASLLFGGIIAYSGFKLVRKSVSGLMDETDDELMQKVVNTIRSNKKLYWVDVHNLRVQQYGSDLHIDCHLTLPYYWTLQETHEAIHEFENVLKASHEGETEIFVHADPCVPECCHFCRVAHCPVRSHPFQHDLDWDVVNLAKNQKLFMEAQLKRPD
ncbi:cation diffusion facilitator family transporter [Rhabdobacter roseus]|uniref:Cation diffusion facilitator family transporter n=1 Tax=Rhabdobacter roseus TaxID=1655419 RepID=A0A840TNS2_9BACT|nr:cation diffusion facilitator family transporter [Rhabdobacter roseus]MBB5283202.1 cation diffusion facilitator family transporter [Rhabdobacter roseus]